MARILYGIHGTGHGHAMRGLTIARSLPQHEFLFIANDDAPDVLEPEFRVERLPNLGTVFKNYRVDLSATIRAAVPLLLHQKRYIKKALQIIENFKPDVCMTDLEFFTPRAAQMAGLPCLTLDHQHVLTCCQHSLPTNLRWDAFLQGLTPRYLFKPTAANLIISFYAPPVSPLYNAFVAPPILRKQLLNAIPCDDDHILVYQSNSTDRRLIDFLKTSTNRKAYVFGYGETSGQYGNVIFRPKSEAEFLELLTGCSYVIQGGSHTLMSEALYLGKPVITLPIAAMVEQRLNALYMERLGYGKQARMEDLNWEFLTDFEEKLPLYSANIGKGNFLGNNMVFGLVDEYARSGKFPAWPDKAAVSSGRQ